MDEKLYRLLIVDDEADIVSLLRDFFEMTGYEVTTADSGEAAMRMLEKSPDLILLDINMPNGNGFEVCKAIRPFVTCPILFLTARVEDGDRVAGFAVGGDDYILKPFSIEELGARVAAHLRREERLHNKTAAHIHFEGGLVVDYTERCAYYNGDSLGLAKKEFDILALLSQNQGQVFTKERIYERIWGYNGKGDSAVVAEHIRRIRAKMEAAGCAQSVETVWGVGYKWAR